MMPRPFKAAEMSAYVERRGHEPTFLLVAWEMLALYAHQDNPITSLTLPQLDAIYSLNRFIWWSTRNPASPSLHSLRYSFDSCLADRGRPSSPMKDTLR